MFYIKAILNGDLLTKSWKFDEEKPELHPHAKIIHLDASGNALLYIKYRFNDLPIVKGNSCVWEAPWAQFIFDNLKD